MKRRIRLTEGDLHRIVKNSIKRVLRENEEMGMGAGSKGQAIINALKKLNFEERGHKIMNYLDEYPAEIAVSNINVPAIADCKEIANRFGVEFYTDFGMGIFEVDDEEDY